VLERNATYLRVEAQDPVQVHPIVKQATLDLFGGIPSEFELCEARANFIAGLRVLLDEYEDALGVIVRKKAART
jgi:hypothetical protein